MKYRLSEIAEVCHGTLSGADVEVREVITDSRCCDFGEKPVFVAMRGTNHDSHLYVGQMYGRGVRAFIVEHDVEPFEGVGDCGFVKVENAIEALQLWAAHHRSQFHGTVVGITGSNGKTVVKEWISQSVPSSVALFRSPKSYNSQLGVPLSVLMIEGDEQVALIEAGISHVGEMERLERVIRPDVVIFTSLGDAHQENFDSSEQKTAEKLILARHARKIIYHSYYEPMATMINSRYADTELYNAASYHNLGCEFADEASMRNAQIVAAFCDVMQYPSPDLHELQPVAMRLEVKDGINNSIIIDDYYNSDINSVAIALNFLHSVSTGRKMTLVLSDILQSGMSNDELYSRVAQMVAQTGIDRVVGVGQAISTQADKFHCDKAFYTSTDEFIRNISRDDIADRAILLKGNRASRFERLSHAIERKSHTTILEVNLDAMIHNLNYFRSKLKPSTKLVAMVKAGSYGAGDFEVAQMLQHQGVTYLAVAFADEGVLLRERGISMPIVVLNADEGSFEQMIVSHLEPEIYSFRSLEAFERAAERYGEHQYPIHIKLDTGMHRLGFMEEDLDELNARLNATHNLRVATIFSHLNCSDTPSQDEYTLGQIARYDAMSSRVADALPYRVIRHTANSAAIERFPQAQFDMCRLGLGLYGFGYEHNAGLIPVSTLKTRIVQIKHLKAGDAVGYGRVGVLTRDTTTATIPMGYADGLDRHLGCGRWSMLVGSGKAPIVGRVCMDSCMIDITDIEGVEDGDEVTIFSAAEGNNLEDMARVLDTISYEIMTSISARVKRIYSINN